MTIKPHKQKKGKRLMKKTYQHPTTDVVLVSLSQMIAASKEGGLLKEDNNGDPNDLNLDDIADTEATSGNLSRRSVWDDEEEEQY